jgi:tyrosyl-tRNA synthetase
MVNSDPKKIVDVLSRGVSEIIVKNDLQRKLLSGEKLRLYFGIDPTGLLLHLGHAVVLRKLQEFANLGHEVILLIGDFTAKIGDPTGRDAMRVPLTDKQIKENFKNYKQQASKVLDFSKIKIKYNSAWLSKLNFDKIIELSSHITVQQMLQRDMFKKRMNIILQCPKCGREIPFPVKESDDRKILESITPGRDIVPICSKCGYGKNMEQENKWIQKNPSGPVGLNEFLYPLMQGYDSVVMDVDLEIGGNDQLFNMLIGRDLQKKLNQKDKDVLAVNLLLGTDGRKMSKTYDNAIYLNDLPNDMFGKIMSINDELIRDYVELCTNLDSQEIKKIPNPRDQKVLLAKEIVKIYYGEEEARKAEEEFNKIFRDKGVPSEIEKFKIDGPITITDLLVKAGLAPSKSEAKRLILQHGVKIDGIVQQDWRSIITMQKGKHTIQVGKRKFLELI